MALIREYKKLFKVRTVKHGAEAQAVSFLRFAPTSKCVERLRDFGLLFKHRENGFDISYSKTSASADSLIAPIASRVRFSFTIQSSNPLALDKFEPDISDGFGHQYYFDNLRADFQIKLINNTTMAVESTVGLDDIVRIYPRFFVRVASPPLPEKYEVDPSIVDGISKVFDDVGVSTDIDMRDRPEGVYLLTSRPDGKETLLYLDDEVGRQTVLGVVDLYWESPQSSVADDGLSYRITFKPKAA